MNLTSSLIPDVIPYRKHICEDDLWLTHAPGVFRAERFVGKPCFLPVYAYRDYFSYSVLPLLLLKNRLNPDAELAIASASPKFLYYSGCRTIDRDIRRIGGPLCSRPRIRHPKELVKQVASAMRAVVSRVEEANSGFTNVILCGGLDSLNLLLLPWENPVIVASATPNYELVKEFIEMNGLGFRVMELTDVATSEELDREVAASCCLLELRNVRWSSHLRRISDSLERRVVFWQGSIADAILTPKGRGYAQQHAVATADFLRCVRRIVARIPGGRRYIRTDDYTSRLFNALWHRAAMWQGTSHSVFRTVSESLVVSGYHGAPMYNVWEQLDLSVAVQTDVRPQIGEYLAGRPVDYPVNNPGPVPSSIRAGIVHPKRFYKLLEGLGVEVPASSNVVL